MKVNLRCFTALGLCDDFVKENDTDKSPFLFHKNNCVFEKKLHDNTKIDQPLVPPCLSPYDWKIESFVSTVLIIFLFLSQREKQ